MTLHRPIRWPKEAFAPAWTLGFTAVLGFLGILAIATYGFTLFFWAAYTHRFSAVLAAINAPDASALGFVLANLGQIFLEAGIGVGILCGLPRLTHVSLRGLGFRCLGLDSIGYATGGAMLMLVVSYLGLMAAAAFRHPVAQGFLDQALAHFQANVPAVVFVVLYTVVLSAVLEELIFRIFLFNLGSRYVGFWGGALMSSVLFGLVHAGGPSSMQDGLIAAACGIVLSGVYYRSRNAFAPMISHSVFNLVSTLAFYAVR